MMSFFNKIYYKIVNRLVKCHMYVSCHCLEITESTSVIVKTVINGIHVVNAVVSHKSSVSQTV